jgi:uncharacterized membrane protein
LRHVDAPGAGPGSSQRPLIGSHRRPFKRYLLTGLVAIAPVGVTVFVLWWIFQQTDNLLGRFLYPAIGRPIPGLGLLALLLVLLFVGWVAELAIGHRVLNWWHALLERFPLTRGVYGASSRIFRTVFGSERRMIGQVVLVQYPSPGRWSVGFMTSRAPSTMDPLLDDPVAIFVPTTPNPTSGWMVIVPRAETIPLPMTVEQAFTYVLSGGAVVPDALQAAPPIVPPENLVPPGRS